MAVLAKSRGDKVDRREGNTEPQPRDIFWFQWMNYHGPQSVQYLTEAAVYSFPTTTLGNAGVRLHSLYYYGTRRLDRVMKRLFGLPFGKSNTYANSAEIDDFLYSAGYITEPSVSLNRINFHHENFRSHITASIEIASWEHKLEFVRQKVRTVPVTISHKRKVWDDQHNTMRPRTLSSNIPYRSDGYFHLKRGDKCTALVLEADCGTEQGFATNLNRKSWEATLLKLIQIVESGAYKKHYDLKDDDGFLALCVFTSKTQMEKVQRVLEFITEGKGKSYILFALWHEFGDVNYVPKEVNYSLLEEPWLRSGQHPPITLV